MDYKYSQFFYGHIVDSTNNYIDFKEGSTVKYAELRLKAYTLDEYTKELQRALNQSGNLVYTCTVDRATRFITISASDDFELLNASGDNLENSFISLAGFEESDLSGASSYTGTIASGKVYSPQAPISQYTPFEYWNGLSSSSTSISIAGRRKSVSFGQDSFCEMNIYPISDLDIPANSIWRNDQSAVSKTLEFFKYMTDGNPVEFMFDASTPNAYTKCYLSKTRESNEGNEFKLKKHKNIQNVFETGLITFRKIYA